MWSAIRHYGRQLALMLWGPPQLDEQHDPMVIEDRRYEHEREVGHEKRQHRERKDR